MLASEGRGSRANPAEADSGAGQGEGEGQGPVAGADWVCLENSTAARGSGGKEGVVRGGSRRGASQGHTEDLDLIQKVMGGPPGAGEGGGDKDEWQQDSSGGFLFSYPRAPRLPAHSRAPWPGALAYCVHVRSC